MLAMNQKPVPGFYFDVRITGGIKKPSMSGGLKGAAKSMLGSAMSAAMSIMDSGFTSVSGITLKYNYGKDGKGEKGGCACDDDKKGQITLTRGLPSFPSPLTAWCQITLSQEENSGQVDKKIMVLTLMNGQHQIVMAWMFKNVLPIEYTIDGFDSMQNGYIKEKFVFEYEGLTAIPVPPLPSVPSLSLG